MKRRVCVAALLAAIAIIAEWPRVTAQSLPTVTANLPSGQPVGTRITWQVSNGAPGQRYRLRGTLLGITRVFSDFNVRQTFIWTPSENGTYQLQWTVQNPDLSEVALPPIWFEIRSRATSQPVVSATEHPLIALYSAPPCNPTQSMRVAVRAVLSANVQQTAPKPCRIGASMDFYVTGMRADSAYVIYHEMLTSAGSVAAKGPSLLHRTGPVTVNLPATWLTVAPGPSTSVAERFLLLTPTASVSGLPFPFATDLSGSPVWYFQPPDFMRFGTYFTRPQPGGTFLLLQPEGTGWNDVVYAQVLREIDIAGNVVRETNRARINQQLAARGDDLVGGFHHEFTRLPNGHMAVIAGVERLLADTQGPGLVDVLGDMVIVLDQDWQVVWTWTSFDHLDTRRMATLNETCDIPPGLTCNVPITLATTANDWLHSNTISYSPADGDLIVSVRNQDWVVKIDYNDGTGSGNVVWTLGRGGDFALSTGNDYDWFTHQHDVTYIDANRIAIYDNGSQRCLTSSNPSQDCYSRGQVMTLDEVNKVATLELNVNLGKFSVALGSAQRLSNGNFHFDSGSILPSYRSAGDEFTPDGTLVYSLRSTASAYRSFRMRSFDQP